MVLDQPLDDEIEDHEEKNGELGRLHIHQLLQMVLQDAQTRLFFKAQSVIQSEIRYYVPTAQDLAYPDKLVGGFPILFHAPFLKLGCSGSRGCNRVRNSREAKYQQAVRRPRAESAGNMVSNPRQDRLGTVAVTRLRSGKPLYVTLLLMNPDPMLRNIYIADDFQ